ncbi:MAG: XkdX family protein [Clostridia bacterium]|nr:XkdX family protein [Clostridia bacterium]
MFENLKYLYEKGLLSAAELDRAVGLGWISQEQKQKIIEG